MALAYSPDGKYLASAGLDGVVILRDARTNEVVGQRHLDLGKLGALTWRADSSGMILGGEKLIAVCELGELLVKEKPRPRGEPLSLAGHSYKVEGLSYSRDRRTLVSWTRHHDWRFWDLSGGAGQAKERTPTATARRWWAASACTTGRENADTPSTWPPRRDTARERSTSGWAARSNTSEGCTPWPD
jgi:WD40 repeat protein